VTTHTSSLLLVLGGWPFQVMNISLDDSTLRLVKLVDKTTSPILQGLKFLLVLF
jgi:hypothetical protein